MFRENVLIALTILITILALSFVILLTVYLQIHQIDERIKRFEEEHEISVPDPESKEDNFSSVIEAAVEQNLRQIKDDDDDTHQQTVRLRPVEMIIPDPFDAEPKNVDKPLNSNGWNGRETKSIPKISKPLIRTTENPDDAGFYTDDDFFIQFPKPPPNSRRIPYNLFNRNGHVILELPTNINLSNDIDDIKTVLESLNELFQVQKARDQEQKQFAINGFKPWYPPTKEKQTGQIWIRNSQSQGSTDAPKSKDEPFDDSAIFNLVSNNRMRRFGPMGLDPFEAIFGKRKKRSLADTSFSRSELGEDYRKMRSI